MRHILIFICTAAVLAGAGCDMRSGIARKEMEKYEKTPLPAISPTPTEIPIDPADIVEADLSQTGATINVNADGKKQTIECKQLNNIMVNGGQNELTVKGVCRQIMVNGDKNTINADASIEYVLNGSDNQINYARFVNGKRPNVTENKDGNTVEHNASTPNK